MSIFFCQGNGHTVFAPAATAFSSSWTSAEKSALSRRDKARLMLHDTAGPVFDSRCGSLAVLLLASQMRFIAVEMADCKNEVMVSDSLQRRHLEEKPLCGHSFDPLDEASAIRNAGPSGFAANKRSLARAARTRAAERDAA